MLTKTCDLVENVFDCTRSWVTTGDQQFRWQLMAEDKKKIQETWRKQTQHDLVMDEIGEWREWENQWWPPFLPSVDGAPCKGIWDEKRGSKVGIGKRETVLYWIYSFWGVWGNLCGYFQETMDYTGLVFSKKNWVGSACSKCPIFLGTKALGKDVIA